MHDLNGHLKWFANTGEKLKTADGIEVEVWDFNHNNDDQILSSWAKHFRNHYCLDSDIDFLRGKKSRKDYLNDIKFPSKKTRLGPSIRAGDFGEILIADFLQWVLNFWVPRFRWGSKIISDESSKGCDVIGFHFHKQKKISSKDILAVIEAKTKFSKSSENRMQDAINDSAKDHIRIDESLNFIKQKLFEKNCLEEAKLVERFQSPVDIPYQEFFGAAALYSDNYYQKDEIGSANANKIPESKKSKKIISHPYRDRINLIVVKGINMMPLVHALYKRSADEA